ncbi:MAG TPA: glycosyltransferase family 39 protein [Candidatus Saccharimonadales bacterium]|jgi:4-amino-4-deoxy-L-arabinose transferase-like glycosyltransferase|nr:glycosyltransferase family 39 protein [Candidatus Saccharimonadales bacterium]
MSGPQPGSSSKAWLLQLAVVVGVCAFVFFFGLGSFGLVGADEPRYAQIGREMLARHDWITPVLNGKPWLEKPILLYWNEMAAYSLFGVVDWAARVPSALFGSCLVLAIFFFTRRFRPGAEMDAALMAASMAAIIGFGRGASTDMQISAPFCVAMLAWWAWNETGRKLWLGWFYALLAIGTLAKGPVAPGLAVLIVAAYAGLRRQKSIFFHTLWLPGFLIYFAITLPWLIAVQIRTPEFFRVFFIEHNLERFGTNLYQHQQPFWYYIPVFLASVLPWTVFAASAVVEAGASWVRSFRTEKQEGESAEEASGVWLSRYLLLWIAIPIIFFSISRSKLPGYILPAIPPVAVLTADYLRRVNNALSRWRLQLHAVICGMLAGGALLAPWRMDRISPPAFVQVRVVMVTAIVALLVFLVVRRGGVRILRLATLVPVLLVLGFLLRPAAHTIDQATSARAIEAELQAAGITPQTPVAVFNVKREVEFGLNFYRNRSIPRYERDGIPAQDHLLAAREGSEDAVSALAAPRKVTGIGRLSQQHLELFLVSNIK